MQMPNKTQFYFVKIGVAYILCMSFAHATTHHYLWLQRNYMGVAITALFDALLGATLIFFGYHAPRVIHHPKGPLVFWIVYRVNLLACIGMPAVLAYLISQEAELDRLDMLCVAVALGLTIGYTYCLLDSLGKRKWKLLVRAY